MMTSWTYGTKQAYARSFKRYIQVKVLETLSPFVMHPWSFNFTVVSNVLRKSALAVHAVDLRASPKSAAYNKRYALPSEQLSIAASFNSSRASVQKNTH